jgi:predicted ATP-dependent endonuclease of OLD family
MRLKKARVQNYRSVRDSGWLEVETTKTIFVGPNEAGKSAILQALQQLNRPSGVNGFDPLRDYPRSSYTDIVKGIVKPESTTIVEGHFTLEDNDKAEIPEAFQDYIFKVERRLDNTAWYNFVDGPSKPFYKDIEKDLARLVAHIDGRQSAPAAGAAAPALPSALLTEITKTLNDWSPLAGDAGKKIEEWLKANFAKIEEGNKAEEERYDRILAVITLARDRDKALDTLFKRIPVFVLFNNYFRVRPLIHLEHLAQRLETKVLDDEEYDYGNQCLLKLLGFTARQLSNLGKAAEPAANDQAALKKYRDQLDTRSYQLNAASVRLTDEINGVWLPDMKRDEASRLKVLADGQYLKVIVEDELGVEVELNQRSEGFQWLVSFFVVFFAEAAEKHSNAILLLDEPGLSLHGLKQRDFRKTLSKLAEKNQTLYTTHSPFLVGPDELDIVRVVEMPDRRVGTKVVTTVTAKDPAGLLPLQEALGYDLAQSLFGQQRNLVLEGLTDYWYLEGAAQLVGEAGIASLNEKIVLVPANTAGKVVYYATILFAQGLKVAALLDSDAAGDQAATQENLVHTLGNKNILRTKDVYVGAVPRPQIEDLLRETLVNLAKADLNWDVTATANVQPNRSIVEICEGEIKDFSKYRLAKAFLRWSRTHSANDLTQGERDQWKALIEKINKALS